MTVIKVSIPMQKQIFELHNKGYSNRKIAKLLKVGRNTVRDVLERGEVVAPGALRPEWAKQIDWQKVHVEVSRGVQLNILAKEHAGDVISYVQFWREYHKQYPATPQATMRLTHKPGEKCFFDYTEGIDIVDASTGEVQKTQLLCGVMAMSSYVYGEFTLTQKRNDLMRAMENAFRYFGGVTPYVTVDNQKAAIDQAHWYDPDVNPTFIDFANHWGFAVVPARPYRPRDKASNESNIGVIQRQFFQEVRERKFYSLAELNGVFRAYLERLNASEMKDWGVSRRDRFLGEVDFLKSLPSTNWEMAEWRKAKAHADCHVQVMKKFYSVPYQHVGKEVRVKVTAKLIEVFDQELNPLACHMRLHGNKETHATDSRHYPEEKLALTQFSVKMALRDAARIGPETEKLVSALLGGVYPLKYLRRVQGVLRLFSSGRVTTAALEHASRFALLYGKTHFAYIQATAEHFDKFGNKPTAVRSAPVRELASVYLHGGNENSFEREETHDQ